MPGISFAVPETAVDAIGELNGDIKKPAFSRRFEISDSRFDHMPGAVQLVVGPSCEAVCPFHGKEMDIEISLRGLTLLYFINDCVNGLLQFRRRFGA
jgi:hypothetical protein